MSLNKSFEVQSSYFLPPINRNESSNFPKTHRSQSHHEIKPVGQLNTTPVARKLIATDNLKNPDQYDEMNEKQLLREHENLLKVLKKYQELIDINLVKKQKQREREAVQKARGGEKKASKEEVMAGEINNNKKIIANYLREIKQLENAQKHRKLHEVLQQKAEVNEAIGKIKKQIFHLKNEDTMASRNLVNDRGQIEKQLKDAEKDLKTELTRNAEYKKKIEDLTQHLKNLKKQCENINVSEITTASHQKQYIFALSEKKAEIQEAQRSYARAQESIQEVIINKTKRNNALTKDIENMDKKMTELNNKIASYKEKVSRYHKVLDPHSK